MIKIITKKQYLQMQEEIEKLKNWCQNADRELHKKEEIIVDLQNNTIELHQKIKNQEKELRNGRTKWR